MKKLRFAPVLALLAVLLSLCGCGGDSPKTQIASGRGRATFVVHWPTRSTRLIPVASNSIQVIIQRNGANVATQLLPRPQNGNMTSATFDPLPTGDLTVTATAFPKADGTGTAQATGATTITIQSGQNTAVNLTMGSTITQVVVLPANPTVFFGNGPGNTVMLTASAMDANGNLVLTTPAKFTWSKFDAHELTVTPNGNMAMVVGSGIGRSSITATETESNIAGNDSVTVRGKGPPAASNGPKFRVNQQNTGLTTGFAASGVFRWLFSTKSLVESSAAIGADRTVYIGSGDGNIYALKPTDGSPKWSVGIGGNIRCSPALGADGSIYIGSTTGQVFCLDKNDGSIKWQQFFFGSSFLSSPNIDNNGSVYIGSENGGVFALDGSTGDQKWFFQTGGAVESSPALSADNSVLYIGSGDKRLHAIFTADGSEKWQRAVGGSIKSSPAVNPTFGVLYFGADDGNVYALRESDGSFFWDVPFATGGAITSSPALSRVITGSSLLFIGSSDGKLYAIDGQTGLQAAPPFQSGGSIRSSPTMDGNGNVVFGSDDLNVYALNLKQTFSVIWKFKAQGSIASSPAIAADGTVYIGSDDQNVYAIGGLGF